MTQEIEKIILEFLQKGYPRDFSIKEISSKTDVHRNTVSKYVFGLEKVKISRSVGRAKMYLAVETV
jgi:DNA-binding IclR family transcriptional regulator